MDKLEELNQQKAGGTGNAPGAQAAGGQETGSAAAGATNSGGTGQAEGLITFKSKEELQSHVEAILKERLEREKRKQEAATVKAKEDAEADALVKNQEWQKLAEQREGKLGELEKRIAELEPYQEKTERYEKALKAHLETQRQGLAAHMLTLLDKLDPVEQLEYIAANREALNAPTQGQDGKRPAGTPATPAPGGNNQLTPEEKKRKAFSIRNL